MRRGVTLVATSILSSSLAASRPCSSAPMGSAPVTERSMPDEPQHSEVEKGKPDATPLSSSMSAPSIAVATSATTTAPRLRMAVVRPDLVDDWVPELNDANVQAVECRSREPYWWRCGLCQHIYQVSVRERVALGQACCPRCHGRRDGSGGRKEKLANERADGEAGGASAHVHRSGHQGNQNGRAETAAASNRQPDGPSLAESHPALAARWDFARNGLLKPTHVTAESTVSVWWLPSSSPQPPELPPSTSSPSSASTAMDKDDAEGRERRPSQKSSPQPRSFRRAVFAFVADPHSTEEKLAAEAALEERLLTSIRVAARIEEAGQQATFPASVYNEMQARRVRETGELVGSVASPTAAHVLGGNDVKAAVSLWKQRVSHVLHGQRQQQQQRRDGPQGSTGRHRRQIFHISSARLDPVAAAAVTREEVLRSYVNFVRSHQTVPDLAAGAANGSESEGSAQQTAQKPIDALWNAPGGLVLQQDHWLDAFTLTSEDVKAVSGGDTGAATTPKSTSSSARLSEQAILLTGAAHTFPSSPLSSLFTPFGGGAVRRHIPPPPPPPPQGEQSHQRSRGKAMTGGEPFSKNIFNLSDEHAEVAKVQTFMSETFPLQDSVSRTMAAYPRRPPPFPPRRQEDDVTEATPPSSSLNSDFSFSATRHTGPSDSTSSVGDGHRSATLGKDGEGEDREEYGKFHKRPLMWMMSSTSSQTASAVAAAAAAQDDDVELEVSIRSQDAERHLHEAGELGKAPTASSLLADAVAALGEPVALSKEEKRALQYARERAPDMSLARPAGASLFTPRRTAQRPRTFRLRLPDTSTLGAGGDSDRSARTVLGAHAIAAGGPADVAAAPRSFEAPNTPRKVARPRRPSLQQRQQGEEGNA